MLSLLENHYTEGGPIVIHREYSDCQMPKVLRTGFCITRNELYKTIEKFVGNIVSYARVNIKDENIKKVLDRLTEQIIGKKEKIYCYDLKTPISSVELNIDEYEEDDGEMETTRYSIDGLKVEIDGEIYDFIDYVETEFYSEDELFQELESSLGVIRDNIDY